MAAMMPMVHASGRRWPSAPGPLPAEQWTAPDVLRAMERAGAQVGHLPTAAAGNITSCTSSAGSPAPASTSGSLRCRRRPPPLMRPVRLAEVKASLRQDHRQRPQSRPVPPTSVLGEIIMVHGEDIRTRPRRRGEHAPEHLITLAERLQEDRCSLFAGQASGSSALRLEDCRTSTGRRAPGPRCAGPCMSLDPRDGRSALQALADCEGPGVETLRSRSGVRLLVGDGAKTSTSPGFLTVRSWLAFVVPRDVSEPARSVTPSFVVGTVEVALDGARR